MVIYYPSPSYSSPFSFSVEIIGFRLFALLLWSGRGNGEKGRGGGNKNGVGEMERGGVKWSGVMV